MADLKVARLVAPTGGIDERSSSDRMAPDKARALNNALCVIPGYVSLRGTLSRLGAIATKTGRVIGGPSHNDRVLTGHWDSVSEPINEFGILCADAELTPGNRYVSAAGAATDITAAADKNVTPLNSRGGRIDALTYYLSATTTAAAQQTVYGTTAINKRRVVSWDGALATTILTNGPGYAIDIATYAERVFVLGGQPPGGGTFSDSDLYYSDPGGPTADTAAMWQDDVSGVVNKLRVGQQDSADYGVALCPINNGLAILKRRSVWVLRGSGPQTFQVRKFSGDLGCTNTDSVIAWRDGCLFRSERGIMYFDGSQLVEMSEGISLYGTSDHLRVASLDNDHFLFYFGSVHYVLNARDRVWTTFTFDSLFQEIPLFVHSTKPLVIDRAAVWDASSLSIPLENAASAATETNYDGTSTTAVNMQISYRPLRIGTAGYAAQLHRVIVNYQFGMNTVGPWDTAGAFTVYSSSPTLGTTTELASTSLPAAFTQVIADYHAECESVTIGVGVGNDDIANELFTSCNVGDILVEYQPTRQRR